MPEPRPSVALVAANMAITDRAGRGVHFALLLAINFALIYAGGRALSDRGNLPVYTGLFFAYLTTLIVVLFDTYRAVRVELAGLEPATSWVRSRRSPN